METSQIIEIGIELLLFLAASYLLFYRSFIKALGRETAKLVTAEQLTSIKESVKKDFNESLESYKQKLNQELSEKIEPLKSELAKNNISHQIQFAFLHQERGKVLKDLYSKLIELNSAMLDYTAQMHGVIVDAEKEEEERRKRTSIAVVEFQTFYMQNKIFLSKKLCVKMDVLAEKYWNQGWEYGYMKSLLKTTRLDSHTFQDFAKKAAEISKSIKQDLPPLIAEIEDDVRSILGVVD